MSERPARLILLTDRTLLSPTWTLAQAVAPAVTGGIDLVVFRESDLPSGPRRTVARFVRDGVGGRVPFVTSGSPQFSRECGADGVHVESASVAEARAELGPDAWVGYTATTLDSGRQACEEGADYLLINVDWQSPDSALQALHAYAAVGCPIIAGIDPPLERVAPCLAAGATGVALCRIPMSAYNRGEAVRAYVEGMRG